MKTVIIYSVLTLSLVCLASGGNPKGMSKCDWGDEKCIIKNLNTFASEHYKGDPESGLAPFDPLKFVTLEIGSDSDGPVSLKVTFSNSLLTGLKDTKFTKAEGYAKDFDGKDVTIEATVPSLKGTGDVKLKGKMMILKLDNEGKSDLEFQDLKASLKCKLKKVKKGGKDYLHYENCLVHLEPKKMKIDATALFPKDKTMATSMNKVFNENWKEILDSVRPSAEKGVGKIFEDAFNSLADKSPADELFN